MLDNSEISTYLLLLLLLREIRRLLGPLTGGLERSRLLLSAIGNMFRIDRRNKGIAGGQGE